MKIYAFILGRESKLSLAELVQVLRAENKTFKLESFGDDVALIKTDLFSEELFHRLGGSVKFAEVKSVKREDLLPRVERSIRKKESGEKFSIGYSVYSIAGEKKAVLGLKKELRPEFFALKKKLKDQLHALRIVESKEDQLSSVVVKKNHLVSNHGIEFLILQDGDKFFMGETIAVQDFEAFAQRDHARPFRDDRSGMLPPKLARMMINLSGIIIDHDTTLLDPFCGSGTVLQEAVLMGAGKVLGGDLSEKAMMDSLGNLKWLSQQQLLSADVRVEQVDVTDLSSWLPENFVDLIVTEPYLGTPVRGKLSKQEIKERQDSLSELYDQAFIQFHHVLKPGGVAVMIFPFIQNSRLPLPRHMCRLFEQMNVGDEVISSNRLGIDYQRPGQAVGREIMILKKK